MNELTLMLSTSERRILAEYLLIAQQAVLSAAESAGKQRPALDDYLRSHASQAADLRARVLRIKPAN